ncbi:MAG: hypothetical protein N2689_10140 [Verrucomicrobiae bacterium]|nr:hypothetical protein [Verrucomicrobiae bacterium]
MTYARKRLRALVMFFLGAALLMGGSRSSEAVLFYSTGDPSFNTNAPTGSLTNSGWQWQGVWQSAYLGTAIASNFFITARHLNGKVGDVFTFGGVSYTTTALYTTGGVDLAVWQVNGSFPTWAPLYGRSDELGRSFVVIGRGTLRGAEVVVDGELKGWRWGSGSGLWRWGENEVAEVLSYGGYGSLLYATFDAGAGVNECDLSVGDSGGGLFIKDGETWKLAGINFAVDGNFNTTNSGNGFSAAIFDAGGLWYGSAGNWTYITNQSYDIPTGFYATRISSNRSWIESIIIPEPATLWLAAAAWPLLLARRGRRR